MPQPQRWTPPAPPEQPQQEGARWRFHRPSSEAVAAWFATQPLDEGMAHERYVGGVVLIPQSEKVKYTSPEGMQIERYEQVFTPYVQIGTRVGYFRLLAEHRDLRWKIGPAAVPRSANPGSPYFNMNMPDGMWWHVVATEHGQAIRYLCATYEVVMYERTTYGRKLAGKEEEPVLYGVGTKQVSGGADPNGLMKAQTGAIGRALGAAGILVVGTGIATAEDMQEFSGLAAPMPESGAQLPAPTEIVQGPPLAPRSDAEELDQLKARAIELQTQLAERAPDAWRIFAAWFRERAQESGWERGLDSVPLDALKGIIARMERDLAAAPAPVEETGVQS